MSTLTFTLESLPEDAVEHGAAVVAERRRGVRARLEAVRHVELEPLSHQLSVEHVLHETSRKAT